MGMGVTDPYVPMIAYTEEQSDELAYGALLAMLGEGPLIDDFDLGLERIIVLGENGRAAGKAVALAGSPDARDGARTTFQCFDETHRMTLERLIKAHQTMLANAGGKRPESTPWSLEITTAFEPGLGSVAEGTMEYAQKVAAGRVENSRLFFFHRQATDGIVLRDKEDRPDPAAMRAAVVEAGGPEVTQWSDVDAIVELGLDPQTDNAYWERVWLNRPIQQSLQAFPINKIDKLIAYLPVGLPDEKPKPWAQPPPGSLVVFGFDGAQTRDTTALVGTEVSTGRQFLYALWQNPGTEKTWHVPQQEVDEAVAYAFGHWNVWRLYADPYYWDTHVADWVAKYRKRGEPRVFEWATNTHKKMALSLKAYIAAMNEGAWSYDGNETFRAHLANARKHAIPILDEDGVNLFTIRKERPDSPLKIDAAMAGCLSWEAYRDAIAAGANRSYAFVEL
jgi:phage terminase large subunit-like protein